MVAWNDAPDGREVSRVLENYYDGAIIVIPHPDNEHWCSALNMSNTDGACWCQWGQMTTRKQVDALMALAIEIGVDAGIGMKDIHAALSVIPEYRERLEKCSERKLF